MNVVTEPCYRCGLTDDCLCRTPMTGETIGEAQIIWATAFVMEWPYLTRDAAILLRSAALPNVYDTDHKRRALARQACAEIHNARLSGDTKAEAFIRTMYRLQIGKPIEIAESVEAFGARHRVRASWVDCRLKAEWVR